MIDLSPMRGPIRVEPEALSATAQVGAPRCTLGDVDRTTTQGYGLATPLGVNSDHRDRRPYARWRFRLAQPAAGTHDSTTCSPPRVVTAEGEIVTGERTREPRPVLGHPGRRRQLRHRHVVRVPAPSGRPHGRHHRVDLADRRGRIGARRVPRPGPNPSRRDLAGRGALAGPRRRGVSRQHPRRRRAVHPGPRGDAAGRGRRAAPADRGARRWRDDRHRRPGPVRRVPAVLRCRVPGPHDALLLEVVLRRRPPGRHHRGPGGDLRAAPIPPFDHRHLGQPRRDRARVGRRQRLRPAAAPRGSSARSRTGSPPATTRPTLPGRERSWPRSAGAPI